MFLPPEFSKVTQSWRGISPGDAFGELPMAARHIEYYWL
jgi:hypothetical protein